MESVNQHMKNTRFKVGVVAPADKYYKPVLYSEAQVARDFNQINRDIYDGRKKAKNPNEKKTPPSVFVVLGLGALAFLVALLKKRK